MMESGHLQQDGNHTVLLNAANGVQRFDIDVPKTDIQIDFDVVPVDEGNQDGGLKKVW